MIRKLALGVAGTLWGTLCFGGGLWLAFPEEAAKARLSYELSKSSKDEYAIDMADLSPWRMSGLDARDVKIYTVKKPRKALRGKKARAKAEQDGEGADAAALERTLALGLDRLAFRAALIPTIMGKKAVAFVAETLDGSIDGTFTSSDKGVELEFDAEDLDLTKIPAGDGTTAIHFLGALEGHADLVLNTTDTRASEGTLRFDMPGFGLAKGSKIGGFEVPEVTFDKAVLAFEAQDGKLEVTEGAFESSTLDATVSGDITLNKRLARSRLRLEIIFSLPEDLDQLAQLAPDLKRGRDSEGKYHYLVTGTLLDPNARPSRAGAKGRAFGKNNDEESGDGPAPLLERARDFPLGGGGMDDDERKAAREERLKERRERMRKRREEAAAARGEKGGANDFPPGPEFDPTETPPDVLPYEDMGPPPPEFQDDGPPNVED